MGVTFDVAVIGLGAMGSATLWQLARRGLNVVGIDRFVPPHLHGSSHGETRITRLAIGEGDAYVPLARRSHEIWREMEAATGRRLIEPCGFLLIGHPGDAVAVHGKPGFLASTVGAANRHGIAHELLDAGGIETRFPHFDGLRDGEIAYFEPGGGLLFPEACVAAQLDLARAAGADLRLGVKVGAVRQDASHIGIETSDGRIEAGRAILCVGAWIQQLLGPGYSDLFRVVRQVLHWFPVVDPSSYRPTGLPVFIRLHGSGAGEQFYGFPPQPGAGTIKVAEEVYGETVSPDGPELGPTRQDGERMYDRHLRGRLKGLGPRPVSSTTCLYTNTPDGDFLIDRHPEHDRITIVSACSGHGFKHSAAIGEAVAMQIAAETGGPDLSSFAFARYVRP